MARQVGMFDVEERLAGLSKKGDDLERLGAVIDSRYSGPNSSGRCPGPTGQRAADRRSTTS